MFECDRMSEIPYTPWAGKIPKYFKTIQEVGVPNKVVSSWLRTVGYKSGNDNYILKILHIIGFVDSSKNPTKLWKDYKNPQKAGSVLLKE